MPRRPAPPIRYLRRAGPFALWTSMLVLTLPAFAQGTPRSIGECERLKSDLAYNQCLATFGPEAKMITGGGDGAGGGAVVALPSANAAGIGKAEEIQVDEAPRGRSRGRNAYRSGGRRSASFDVAAAGDETVSVGEATPKPARRRWHRRR